MPVIAISPFESHQSASTNTPSYAHHEPVTPCDHSAKTESETRAAMSSPEVPTASSAAPAQPAIDLTHDEPDEQEIPDESGQFHEPEAEAGPSRSPSRSGSMTIPPPRRHRSGVLMSRARTRSGGGALLNGGGFGMTTSKSSGDLLALSAAGCLADSADGPEETGEEVNNAGPSLDGRQILRRESSGLGGKRIYSEGSRRQTREEEDSMWDNSARFYQHIHSRPPSRAASPEGSPRSVHRVDASSSVSPASPLYLRRSLTLPQNGPGPPSSDGSAGFGSGSGVHGPAQSPNQQFLQSHLPPAFPFPGLSAGTLGAVPENSAGVGSSASSGGLLHPTPLHHPMVILTPTTAEWKELQKEMGDDGADPEGMSSASSAGSSGSASGSPERARAAQTDFNDDRRDSIASADSALGLRLTDRLMGVRSRASLGSEGSRRPSLRSSISADFLETEKVHTPDPGSPAPQETNGTNGNGPSQPVFQSIVTAASPDPSRYQQQEHQSMMAAPMAEPGVHEPDSPTQAFGFGVPPVVPDRQTSVSPSPAKVDSTPESSPDSDEQPARFASIGRRESLRAINKPVTDAAAPPGLVRKKTKRELERERLFRDLDEELQAEQTRPPGLGEIGWTSVREIGAGLGLDSRPASAGSVTSANSGPSNGVRKDRQANENSAQSPPTSPVKGAAGHTASHSSPPRSTTAKSLSTSPTQPLKPSPLHASPLMPRNGLPTSPDDSPSAETETSPLENGLTPGSASQSRRPSQTAKNLESIRDYAKTLMSPHAQQRDLPEGSPPTTAPHSRRPTGRRRATGRVSLVAGRLIQPFTIPPNTSLPPAKTEPTPLIAKGGELLHPQSTSPQKQPRGSLQSFSPFKSSTLSINPPQLNRFDSTTSSIGVPDVPATPSSETAGGVGGGGIDDYVIQSEAGKGAYGLVVRARVKGPHGEPVGDEVIIKYIIKTRILADCWKKHKVLGPIPVEIHVMDQIRHLIYHSPAKPHPWDPSRPRSEASDRANSQPNGDGSSQPASPGRLQPGSPDGLSQRSNSPGFASPTQKLIHSEIKVSPERGHPNICKLLDFFEDREFYYMVMPRYGKGLDLFDYVESSPNGLSAFEARSLVGQLADAVRFLHQNGIVHRDIKDENVILDGTGRCQLIDFGSAAHWRPGKRWDTFSGTLHYASPEILRGEMYGGKEQDVYALGTVMYVLLVGETPFSQLPDEVLVGLREGTSADEALVARCGGEHADEGEEADGGGKLGDAMDLVRRCLEPEVGDRPTAEQMCAHRFLSGAGGWVGPKGWVGRSKMGRSSPRPIMVGASPSPSPTPSSPVRSDTPGQA